MGPFFFNVYRFFLSFLILFAIYLVIEKIRKGRGKAGGALKPVAWQVKRGMLLGLFFSIAVTLQQLGMMTSDAGKCGFISSLYIFFIPIISWFVLRRHISAKIWAGAVIVVIGLFFISMGSSFDIIIGDVLYITAAVFFAVQIILIGNFTPYSNPLLLTSMQMLVCSTLNTVLAFIFERGDAFIIPAAAIWPIIYTGIFTIATGNLLQFIAQKKASPPIAAIILSLESVFAAIFAAIIISERMNIPQITGCGLIFLAIIISQVEFKPKRIEK